MARSKFFLIAALVCNLAFAEVKVFFSPGKGCLNEVISSIQKSEKEIDIAMYDFTHKEIAHALILRFKAGVLVRIITDKAQEKKKDSQLALLSREGIEVKFNQKNRLEHNKFAIFDGKKVLTGSANWTYSAFKKNSENCVFIEDATVANEFLTQFAKLFF